MSRCAENVKVDVRRCAELFNISKKRLRKDGILPENRVGYKLPETLIFYFSQEMFNIGKAQFLKKVQEQQKYPTRPVGTRCACFISPLFSPRQQFGMLTLSQLSSSFD